MWHIAVRDGGVVDVRRGRECGIVGWFGVRREGSMA